MGVNPDELKATEVEQMPAELTYQGIVQRLERVRDPRQPATSGTLKHLPDPKYIDIATIAMCGSNSVLKLGFIPPGMFAEGDRLNVTISKDETLHDVLLDAHTAIAMGMQGLLNQREARAVLNRVAAYGGLASADEIWPSGLPDNYPK